MEGAPKAQEQIKTTDLETLKREGYERGEQLVAEIEGFEQMEYQGQLSVLQELLATLAEDNKNRFAADYVAAKMYDVEITAEQDNLEKKRPNFASYDVANNNRAPLSATG